jgi:2-keto-4-pentenoate hydratase/2-oxohepta-3-ene-1,7-dioic acid hydratase in catechol pathway
MASGCGAAGAIEPDTLQLETFVNGELRQQGTTADLIFGIAELIRFLSADTCLQPGTVILTGTPGGTGSGQHPPAFLAAGDVIEVRCPQIGTLRNTVGG